MCGGAPRLIDPDRSSSIGPCSRFPFPTTSIMAPASVFEMAVMGVLGVSVGSFLNVVIDRVPRNESIVTRSSYCEVCLKRLGPVDLVPVLSYVFLRGKCRHCRAKIPAKLALVELFTGLVFTWIGYEYGFSWDAAIAVGYSSTLIVIFMIDLERSLILYKISFPAVAAAMALSAFRPFNATEGTLEVFWRSMAGGGIGFGVLIFIVLVSLLILSRAGMGEGDPPLGAFIGLMVGFPQVVAALMISFVGGGLVALALITTGKRGRKQAMPFGPFLASSGLACMFWGDKIWDWYIELF